MKKWLLTKHQHVNIFPIYFDQKPLMLKIIIQNHEESMFQHREIEHPFGKNHFPEKTSYDLIHTNVYTIQQMATIYVQMNFNSEIDISVVEFYSKSKPK